ncbi:MAG: 4Fe-4S dicluster domain-containing protein [Chlamydiae bacterium]|nr:4Fe-4S dicluster domain-containing protein [Chlamydiota bacterium]
MARVTIDITRCKGCELCVESCPQGVIAMSKSLNDKGVHFAQPARIEECTGCGLCAMMCPDVIIEVDREETPAPAHAPRPPELDPAGTPPEP